jgi:hypothetical protein
MLLVITIDDNGQCCNKASTRQERVTTNWRANPSVTAKVVFHSFVPTGLLDAVWPVAVRLGENSVTIRRRRLNPSIFAAKCLALDHAADRCSGLLVEVQIRPSDRVHGGLGLAN